MGSPSKVALWTWPTCQLIENKPSTGSKLLFTDIVKYDFGKKELFAMGHKKIDAVTYFGKPKKVTNVF